MFYGNKGQLVKVNAIFDVQRMYFFKELGIVPHIGALDQTHTKVVIHHGELVMLLENSVPPWYTDDYLRCLWNERTVFIRRIYLDRIDG